MPLPTQHIAKACQKAGCERDALTELVLDAKLKKYTAPTASAAPRPPDTDTERAGAFRRACPDEAAPPLGFRAQGLEGLTSLATLSLGSVGLTTLEGLPALPKLLTLDLSDNKLVSLSHLTKDKLPALEKVRPPTHGCDDVNTK